MNALSVKVKLIGSFCALALVCIVTTSISSYRAYQEQVRISKQGLIIQKIEKKATESIFLAKEFLLYDTKKLDYFRTKNSLNYSRKEVAFRKLEELINDKSIAREHLTESEAKRLDEITVQVNVHRSIFNELVDKLNKRGMESFGIEGLIREKALDLEECSLLPKSDLLQLRRFEKDYIIRGESAYIEKLRDQLDVVRQKLVLASYIDSESYACAIENADDYEAYFDQLLDLDRQIGINSRNGLYGSIQICEERLMNAIVEFALKNDAKQLNQQNVTSISNFYWALFIMIASILISILASNSIIGPLKKITSEVESFVGSKFKQEMTLKQIKVKDAETKMLSKNLHYMQRAIMDQLVLMDQQVARRTSELSLEKEKLLQKNLDIEASLNYARSIQKSMLKGHSKISELIPDSFSLNIPKDIVSGDFVYVDNKSVKGKVRTFIALADCTGHGVPACMLSIYCHEAIKTVIDQYPASEPGEILARITSYLADVKFHRNEDRHQDGMTISLCVYEPEEKVLTFSASGQSISLVRNDSVIRYKGDKIPIEISVDYDVCRIFGSTKIHLKEDDFIYLYSDGILDQFGGTAGKKMKYSHFKNVLLDLSSTPIAYQYQRTVQILSEWQGKHEQIDDISLFGLQVSTSKVEALTKSKTRSSFS